MRIDGFRPSTQSNDNKLPDSETGRSNTSPRGDPLLDDIGSSGHGIAPSFQPDLDIDRGPNALNLLKDESLNPLIVIDELGSGIAEKSTNNRNVRPVPPREPVRSSQVPTWPPPYLSHAKLSETKGWHLLNEVTYGLWSAVTVGREGMHIAVSSTDELRTFSATSYLPAANEGALVGSTFAVMEAIGTAHLVWKAGRKKSELDQALRKHAAGRDRFVNGNPEIASLLGERQALSTLLNTWPCDAEAKLLPDWQRDLSASPLNLQRTRADLKGVEEKLEKLALDLAADFEHYVRYEQAANQLAEATDNLHAMGVAAARDSVVQLGGAACNAADAAVKLGVQGVDVAANSVASGAFSIAMGAFHIGAAVVGLYQSGRRLLDLEAARSRRPELRTANGAERLVSEAADHHRQWLTDQAARTESAAVRQSHIAGAAVSASEQAEDAASAKELIGIVLHHQEKAFQAIETDELKKISRAKFRIGYGATSIAIGVGFVVLAATGTGGIFAIAMLAIALAAGVFWLTSGVLRFVNDRKDAGRAANRDVELMAMAQRILQERRQPTIEEMRSNRFVAIEAMLNALLDGDRPVTRCALTEALVSLGMDANLLEAIRLRSSVRLDSTYARDREEISQKLRCFASQAQTDALKAAMEGMALRSDEAMLKPLRQLFQEFIEGKTAMRQEYERWSGALAFLRERLPEPFWKKIGVGEVAYRPAEPL